MGKQLILDAFETVAIPKDEAYELGEFLEGELAAIKKDRWYKENPAKVERKAQLERWIRMLKVLA